MISVSTEINDAKPRPVRGWILFDGHCQFCLAWLRRLHPVLSPRGFAFVPLQTPWVRAYFPLPEDQLLTEMRVVLRNGETHGGAEAIIALAKFVWWAWPLALLGRVPGILPLLRAGYRYIAARRYCADGACAVANFSDLQNKQSYPEEKI